MKTFDLEAFKAGQKALTRNGRIATFIGVCNECRASNRLVAHIHGYDSVFTYFTSGVYPDEDNRYSLYDLVSMVSRHQALIDSYDQEDTWQWSYSGENYWYECGAPLWDEKLDYRLHPHNDLIKAWKKGVKIEKLAGEFGKGYVDDLNPTWNEYTHYRIKPESQTKTVYEWMLKDEDGYWFTRDGLLTEDNAIIEFSGYEYKKTGRSWEVEV